MKCSWCEAELNGGIDTYGPPEMPLCAACWFDYGDLEADTLNARIRAVEDARRIGWKPRFMSTAAQSRMRAVGFETLED